MRRLGMTTLWHRTYGPATRHAVLMLISLVLAFTVGYLACTAFFDLVQDYQQRVHTTAVTTTEGHR